MVFSPRRTIEDLRDSHYNEEIWIIGSGPSLDDFPDKFFEDKTTIGINQIIQFMDVTYWHGVHDRERKWVLENRPDMLEHSIVLFPFCGPFHFGRITEPRDFYNGEEAKPIWMIWNDRRPVKREHFESSVAYIFGGSKSPYHNSGTVAHTAIQAAAVMGADRITLIGCEHKPRGEKICSDKKSVLDYGLEGYAERWIAGTNWLADILRDYGVEVRRYYYGDGYEAI